MPKFSKTYSTLGKETRDPDLPLDAELEESPEQFTGLTGTANDVNEYLTSKLYPLAMESREDRTPINLSERPDAILRALQAGSNVADAPASFVRNKVYGKLSGIDKDDASGEDIVGALEQKIGAPVPEVPGATLKMKDVLGAGTEMALDPALMAAAFPLIRGTVLPKLPREIPQMVVNPRMEVKEGLGQLYKERQGLRDRYGPKSPVEVSPRQTTEETEKLIPEEKLKEAKMEELRNRPQTPPNQLLSKRNKQTTDLIEKQYDPSFGRPKYHEKIGGIVDNLNTGRMSTEQAMQELNAMGLDDSQTDYFIRKLTHLDNSAKRYAESLDRSDPEFFKKILERTSDPEYGKYAELQNMEMSPRYANPKNQPYQSGKKLPPHPKLITAKDMIVETDGIASLNENELKAFFKEIYAPNANNRPLISGIVEKYREINPKDEASWQRFLDEALSMKNKQMRPKN